MRLLLISLMTLFNFINLYSIENELILYINYLYFNSIHLESIISNENIFSFSLPPTPTHLSYPQHRPIPK